jgi:hypothetical protein
LVEKDLFLEDQQHQILRNFMQSQKTKHGWGKIA